MSRAQIPSEVIRKANEGDVVSMKTYATMLEQEKYGTPDFRKSLIYWERAAQKGDAEAQSICGAYYIGGVGCKVNIPKAVEYHRLAADQGIRESQYAYAEAICGIKFDWPVKKDRILAEKYFKLAAKQGEPNAIFHYAQSKWAGDMGPKEPEKAMKWIRRGIELGDARCQVFMGLRLLDGAAPSVKRDPNAATYYFQKAADQEDSDGIARLVSQIMTGRGIKKDYKRAEPLIQKSAEIGNAFGMIYGAWFSLVNEMHDAKIVLDIILEPLLHSPVPVPEPRYVMSYLLLTGPGVKNVKLGIDMFLDAALLQARMRKGRYLLKAKHIYSSSYGSFVTRLRLNHFGLRNVAPPTS